MIDWQTRSIAFDGGLDTKTDPKHVIQGKWTLLENAVRAQAGQVRKRNGYDALPLTIIGGGTIQNPKMVRSFGNRLVCAGQNSNTGRQSLFDFSKTVNAWRDAGQYESIEVNTTFVSGSNVNERAPTHAVAGNYSLITYDAYQNIGDTTAASPLYVGVSILDLQNNTFLLSDSQIKSGGGLTYASKAVLLGASTLGVLYNSSNGLCLRIASISSGGVSLGAEIVLANDLTAFGGINQYPWVSFDCVTTGSGASIAYSSTAAGNPVKFLNIDTTGTVTGTGSVAAAGFAIPLSLCRDAAGNLWTYWADAPSGDLATGTNVYYAIVSSALGSVLGKTQIIAGIPYVRQICAYVVNSTTQNVFLSQMQTKSFSSASSGITVRAYPEIMNAQVGIAGTANPPCPVILTNLDLYSKPFTINGKNYLATVYYSPDQMTGFLLEISAAGIPSVVAKFLPGSAEAAYSTEFNTRIDVGGYWWRQPGSLSVPQIYGNKVLMASAKILEDDLFGGSGSATTNSFIAGTVLVTFDYASADAYQAKNINGSLILNGGLVSQYDGSAVTELGFHAFPEVGATQSNTGGHIPDGTYGYQAIYQWTDAAGNVHRSASSDMINVAITGGTGNASVQLWIKAPVFSTKDRTGFPTQIYVYRTLSNGTIPFLLQIVQTDSTVPQLYYNISDINGSGPNQAQQIYTAGGAVVDNAGVPPSMIMWVNNKRLWLESSETGDDWYSKSVSPGTGVSMSDLLLVAADTNLGKTVLGVGMDEKTVLVKEHGFFVFLGDGADDSGANSTLSIPQIIPADTGGVNSKGGILIPDGLVFKTPKGIYLLSRGLQLTYFGAEVEGFNFQDIQDARIIANVNQVRFLTSSGVSLVFDYFFKQWSVFTNHQGYSSDSWNGQYVYARTDGSIYIENSTGTYLDAGVAYKPRARTGWLKFSSVQGFQRVRKLEMLGDFLLTGGHGVQVSAAYDFGTTFSSPIAFSFSGSNGAFQYEERLPIQKCNALQLLIEEVTTGASGEFIAFSDMDLEVGVKRGLNKLSASRRVG